MSRSAKAARPNDEVIAEIFAEVASAHERLHGAMLRDYEGSSAHAVDAYIAHAHIHAAEHLDDELDASLLDDYTGSDLIQIALSSVDDIIYLVLRDPGQFKKYCEKCRQSDQEYVGALNDDEIAERLADVEWGDEHADDLLGYALDYANGRVVDVLWDALPEPVGTLGLVGVASCTHCRQAAERERAEGLQSDAGVGLSIEIQLD